MSLHKKWGVTHHEARMSTSNFWTAVDQAGCGRDHNYKRIKELFLERFTQREADEFRATFSDLKAKLEQKLDRWAEDNDKEFGLGDDSWGDFLAHIIGMGKHEYDVVMRDPDRGYERAVNGNFKESFSYGIPYKDDYEDQSRQPKSNGTLDLFGAWALPDNFRRNLINIVEDDIKGLEQLVANIESWSQQDFKTGQSFRSLGRWAETHQNPDVGDKDYYTWVSSDFSRALEGNWGPWNQRGVPFSEALKGSEKRLAYLKKLLKEIKGKRPSGA